MALQRMLERLMYGKISRVELNWTQQLIVGYSDTVTADRWKAALPHMFVWIDYACIPQPSCKIPLHQSLIPQEVSCQGSFFASFTNVAKSFSAIPGTTDSDAHLTAMSDDDETKGEPRRTNTTDHRHKSAKSEGSSAKHWLGEAVKVSVHQVKVIVGGTPT